MDNKNKKNPRNIIAQVDKILRRNDIIYWLEAGTALSAVRDGKIFDWEHDIDIGVWKHDIKKILNAIHKPKLPKKLTRKKAVNK